MAKSIDIINEAVRDPKFPCRKANARPKKEQRHRYERRKVKEYLNSTDWCSAMED